MANAVKHSLNCCCGVFALFHVTERFSLQEIGGK